MKDNSIICLSAALCLDSNIHTITKGKSTHNRASKYTINQASQTDTCAAKHCQSSFNIT